MTDTVTRAIVEPLAALAVAHEQAMATGADIIVPAPRVPDCLDCGGRKEWPAWVSLTARCGAPIHFLEGRN